MKVNTRRKFNFVKSNGFNNLLLAIDYNGDVFFSL